MHPESDVVGETPITEDATGEAALEVVNGNGHDAATVDSGEDQANNDHEGVLSRLSLDCSPLLTSVAPGHKSQTQSESSGVPLDTNGHGPKSDVQVALPDGMSFFLGVCLATQTFSY